MKRKLSKFIESNEQLYTYIKRVYNYSFAVNSEQWRYFFLVSLISSDSLIDAESCKKAIEDMTFVKDNIDLITTDEKIKKEVLKYVKDGLKIANRDLKYYENLDNSK